MDQFRTKNLQTFLQFFDLMLNFFVYGGNLMKTIADVNVHSASALLRSAQPSAFLSRLYTRWKKRTKITRLQLRMVRCWKSLQLIILSSGGLQIPERAGIIPVHDVAQTFLIRISHCPG